MNELVSIVIPIYNAEKYLDEAFNSCLNQTYSNIEIIAVDDGSTDNSRAILESYSDKIKIISQKNKGIAGALNTGIKNITGNFYKLMNADDILYPECVEILASEWSKNKNKKTILYSNYDIIDSKGKIIREKLEINRNSLSHFDQAVALLDHQYINCITTIIPLETFTNYGFYNESLEFSEDYELLLRLCLLHGVRFQLIEKKLARYRIHLGQDTVRLMKTVPKYPDKIRRQILSQLDPIQRQKYEISLKQFKKLTPISQRCKRKANDLVLRLLGKSSARRVSKFYRTMARKEPSKYYLE